MKITITIDDSAITSASDKVKDAYFEELNDRVKEVFPQSQIIILHDTSATETKVSVDGFHDDESVIHTVYEVIEDVNLHGYWLKVTE